MNHTKAAQQSIQLLIRCNTNGQCFGLEPQYALLALTAEFVAALERRCQGLQVLRQDDAPLYSAEWGDFPVEFHAAEGEDEDFLPLTELPGCYRVDGLPAGAPVRVECQALHIAPGDDASDFAVYWTAQMKHSSVEVATHALSIRRLRELLADGDGVPKAAMEAVMQYLWHDESAHYAADPSANHIFQQLVTIRNWLQRENCTAADYVHADQEGAEDVE